MIHLNSNVFLGRFIVPWQVRIENKQAKVVIKAGLPCNYYRIFPKKGKKRPLNGFRMTLLSY
jgi:hypothetical protein